MFLKCYFLVHQPPYAADTIPVRPVGHLVKALGFTVAVGAGAFAVAVVTDYERQSQRLRNLFERGRFTNFSGRNWRDLTDGDKCAIILVGANLAIFALWRLTKLHPFMWRYFSNSFASKSLCMPMALSVFSHYSFIHLALNMYVAWSFTNVVVDKFLGPDQFWAFYITAGVVSSLFGLAQKALTRSSVRAVGASGAILGVLGYTCMKIPEARLKIVFVPGFDFSAQSAIIGILLFDLAGLLFRFRMFDHAAHLGGTLFGCFYALIGDDLIWNKYGSIIEQAYRSLKKN
ncbi:peptidase, S54 family [Oesophagostomum dentatum]|uniref:rhomboid protease n=1 Tax=Oesophagostomum dentatum TaxID=61180 RepID=A0A0B1S1R3_OESDE|nr:peptidase, S54 family [Oesophagostomum dentatum]